MHYRSATQTHPAQPSNQDSAPQPTYDFLANVCPGDECMSLQSSHTGVIYDISLDSQRRRLATCSADQTVFIWSMDQSGQWVRDSTIREHGGTAWKVTWANPKFGQMLATCSFDNKRARVFEAVPGDNTDTGRKRWVPVNSFEDILSKPVTDIKFAPPHLGLVLGMCSVDGYLRLIGAESNPKTWKELTHINIKHSSLSCIAFSESTRDRNFVAVGAESVGIDETHSDSAVKAHSYFNMFSLDVKSGDRARSKNFSLSPLDDPKLHIEHPVKTCSFAPVVGRSFQLLAIGSTSVIVFNIKTSAVVSRTSLQYPPNFNHQHVCIWRLTWNITGSQVVASTSHGNVFVWRLVDSGKWDIVACQSKPVVPNIEKLLSDKGTQSA